MTVRRLIASSLMIATTALALDVPTHAREAKGEFVTAYEACTADTTFANPPFSLPGCMPVRKNPLCGFGPSGSGKYTVKAKGSDVAVKASWTGLDAGCEGTTLYLVTDPLRMTTSDCAGGDCTLIDLLAFNLGKCTVQLGQCTIRSTLETFEEIGPDMLKDGQAYGLELGKICAYSLIGSANAFCSGLRVGR